jgi:tetratricopeptide (TPR) repeat protein
MLFNRKFVGYPRGMLAVCVVLLIIGATGCGKKPGHTSGGDSSAQQDFPAGSVFAQAKALQTAKDFQGAVKLYKRGLAEATGPYHAAAGLQLGQMYVELQDVDGAIAGYRDAWTKAPEGASKEDAHAKFLQLIAFERYRDKVTEPGDDPAKRMETVHAVAKWLAGERFVLNGGEVLDTSTGLTWKRCLAGQTFDGGIACEGSPTRVSWDQAQTMAEPGWRLPTAAELMTLFDDRGGKRPRINKIAFPLEKHPYYMQAWSSEAKDGWQTKKYVSYEGDAAAAIGDDPSTVEKTVRLVR